MHFFLGEINLLAFLKHHKKVQALLEMFLKNHWGAYCILSRNYFADEPQLIKTSFYSTYLLMKKVGGI